MDYRSYEIVDFDIYSNICPVMYMNNHIYSTLFKTQEREPDKRSKEIEQRKESQKKHKQNKDM